MSNLFPPHRLLTAAVVALAFAALGRRMRGVSSLGALVGAAIAFALYAGAGLGAFLALASVFVLAWTTTRLGLQRKRALGTAERHDGRSASQVLANLGVAAGCALWYAVSARNPVCLLALAAALAEAAADTVSSEVGQAWGSTTRLITTWRTVPAGTDGGLSLPGTTAGICAALLVSLVCGFTGLLPGRWLALPAGAAIGGMLADSLLGASLERRHWLTNDQVNFLSTLAAAVLAWVIGSSISG